jgi:crotonobetainyl-CoA:carnitine CoA-transferase CaiB-like acyl-CoA transferase
MTAANTPQGPFHDLLIVDISGTVATGYAGKLFADYGARVVNLEPAAGFITRSLEPLLKNGCSAMHGYLHANKESVITDGLVTEHPAVLSADLVLLDPQTLEDSADLDDFDTNLCVISWFGLNGPYSAYQCSDGMIHALTGLASGIGTPEGPPMIPGGYQAQMIGGLSAFNGALGFLLGQQMDKTAGLSTNPFRLDASIFEANMCLTDLGPINSYNNEPRVTRLGINRWAPTYPLGIWPCSDGWLGVTCLNPSQWKAFCKLLDLEDLADVPLFQSSVSRLEASDILEPLFLEALAKWSTEDIFYRGQAMRIPLARVPTMDELFHVDQYVARQAFIEYTCEDATFVGPSIPFRLTKTPPVFGGAAAEPGLHSNQWKTKTHSPAPKAANASNPKPAQLQLQGLKIIDLSMGWAGPLAARNLADLGATVIKVESCTRFDWWRSWEATEEWIASDGAEKARAFLYVNRNKLDVTLDLETPRGRELLLRLVADADALVENYSGSVLPKLKLDYQQLVKANPELVMVSMPAFGSTGPWSEFRAYGSTVEQSSGLPHLLGSEEQPPVMQHIAFGDPIGGLNGTAALLTALYHKQRTGQGQFVDLSQAECLFPLAVHGILHQAVHGEPPERTQLAEHVPRGVYPCAEEDHWIMIEVRNDNEWQLLCGQVPDLAPLHACSTQQRRDQRDIIDATLREWTKNRDERSLMQQLQKAGVPAAALNNREDLITDPQLSARDYLQWLERDYVGRQPHPSPPWRPGKDPIPLRIPAPTLGQHNEAVLKDMLGLSDAEFESLEKAGIIGTRPRLS